MILPAHLARWLEHYRVQFGWVGAFCRSRLCRSGDSEHSRRTCTPKVTRMTCRVRHLYDDRPTSNRGANPQRPRTR